MMIRLAIDESESGRPEVRLIEAGHVVACHEASAGWEQLGALGEDLQRSLCRAWQNAIPVQRHLDELYEGSQRLGDALFSAAFCDDWSAVRPGSMLLEIPRRWLFVPWELAWMAGRSIASQLPCGRTIREVAAEPPSCIEDSEILDDAVYILANADFDLLAAEEEAAVIRLALSKILGPRVRLHVDRNVLSKEQLLRRFTAATWFHFAGHAQQGQDGRGWRLGDRELAASDLKHFLGRTPQMIFAHACGSAGIRRKDDGQSLIESFLRRGTRHYLGLWAPIRDRSAHEFSRAYYPLIAAGQSVGEALLETRHRLAELPQWNELLLSNYVLYGDPDVRYFDSPSTVNSTSADRLRSVPTAVSAVESPAPHARDLSYPQTCMECGRVVKSHFLVQEVQNQDGAPAVRCRYCHANRTMAQETDRNEHRPVRTTQAAPDTLPSQEARKPNEEVVESLIDGNQLPRESTPTEVTPPLADGSPRGSHPAWRQLIENLGEAREFLNPELALPCLGKWRTIVESPLNWVLAEFQGADRASRQRVPDWTLKLVNLDRSSPITVDELRACATAEFDSLVQNIPSGRRTAASWHCLVVVTAAGFTEQTHKAVLTEQIVSFQVPLPIILIDLGAVQPVFSSRDLRQRAVVQFLDWEDAQDRVLRIVEHVERLRPLARSLAAADVAMSLGVPLDAVLIAGRNLSAAGRLRLDYVEPFGWIFSEIHS